jgi:hemerythrin
MYRFLWDDSFATGHAVIDEQHRKLIALIDRLYLGMQEQQGREILKPAFEELADYINVHFSMEARLMTEAGYAKKAHHLDLHEAFVEKVSELRKEFESGDDFLLTLRVSLFLKLWFSDHILQEDKLLAAGIRGEAHGRSPGS